MKKPKTLLLLGVILITIVIFARLQTAKAAITYAVSFKSKAKTFDTTYYVAQNGNDTNPGTKDQPWRTIQKAASTARAEERVIIRGGTYHEMISFRHSGERNKPILFKNYPGEEAIIESPDWATLIISGADWLIIDGIKITGADHDGIYLTNASHNIIQNCEVFDHGSIGIHILSQDGPSNYNIIKGNKIYGVAREAIYLDVKAGFENAVNDNIIQGNEIYGTGEAIQNTNQHGQPPYPNGTIIQDNLIHNNVGDWATLDLSGINLTIENNSIFSNQQEIGGIWLADSWGSLIRNNIIYNNLSRNVNGGGIVLNNVTNTLIEHNSIFSQGSLGIALENTGNDVIVLENTIMDIPFFQQIVVFDGNSLDSLLLCLKNKCSFFQR